MTSGIHIGLVGDFLRFEIDGDRCVNFQDRNMAWLYQMMRPAIEALKPQPRIELCRAPSNVDEMIKVCGDVNVMHAYRKDAAHAWAHLYDASDPPSFIQIFNNLLPFDLVVGFELPPVLKRFLHRAGKPYLSLYIHPLRFLQDLCLGATTNSPHILEALKRCVLNDQEIKHQASRYLALFRRSQIARLAIPSGLPVLIGQTERDSVLINSKGEFDSWISHRYELCEALRDTDAVVFLEHPFCPTSARAVQEIRAATGKTVIATNANSYGLLMTNPDIPFVMTLASSLGVEAAAFGHDARFLLADPRVKFTVPGLDLPLTEPLSHSVWLKSFWQELMGRAPASSTRQRAASFVLGADFLRGSLDSWAFKRLQDGLGGVTVRKTLLESSSLTEHRKRVLHAGLISLEPKNIVDPVHKSEQTIGPEVKLECVPPPLCVGTQQHIELNRRTAVYTLVQGFHEPEPWGCWTSELRSILLVSVDRQAIEMGCRLQIALQLRVFEGIAEACPVLRLSTLDEHLGFVFFRPSHTRQSVSLSVPACHELTELILEMSYMNSSANQGKSKDERFLGLALEGLVISCTRFVGDADHQGMNFPQSWGLHIESSNAEERVE